MALDLEYLNACDADRFSELLGGVFEHSPWIAEASSGERPFESRAALHRAMCAAMRRAPAERQLQLLRSHPELAGREAEAGSLTADSAREQAGAGLDHCSADELARIKSLNAAYRERFGFPFIIAVAGLNRSQIIAAMAARIENSAADEFAGALAEVEKIARIRLGALIHE